MSRACRAVLVAILLSISVLVAPGRASAAPAALVPPLRPFPSQLPDARPATCLPVIGCNPLGGLGQDVAQTMARAVFDVFATFVADGVKAVLDQVSKEMATTTEVSLGSEWFQAHAAVMRGLAIVVLLPLVLVGLISAVIHRDPQQLIRAGLVYIPIAIIGGALAIELTNFAMGASDALTQAVTGDLSGSTDKALGALRDAVAHLSAAGQPDVATFLAIVVLLLLMAGAVVIWIELLLRTSAIYVVVLFLPMAMSGLVWRATIGWTRRMIEVLVALIVSKFVIVVVIDLAAGMITANDGVGTILQGATLLLLAAYAPFALLRLIPMAEAGVIGHLERMERRPIAAANRAAASATRLVLGATTGGAGAAAVSQNGGDAAAALAARQIRGGELNNVNPPPDFTGRPDPPDRPPALALSGAASSDAVVGHGGPVGGNSGPAAPGGGVAGASLSGGSVAGGGSGA